MDYAHAADKNDVKQNALQRTASDLNTAAVCAWVASQAFLDTSQAAIRWGFMLWDTRSLASLTAFCDLRTSVSGGQTGFGNCHCANSRIPQCKCRRLTHDTRQGLGA